MPADTRDLHAEVIEGRDLAAERDARWDQMAADYNQRHPDAPVDL
jgi:hypothetical protein